MKLERCFITSYAWVPSYLLSDSLCFGYDSFHLWTNELLFCENRARSFVSCRGSGWTSASLLTRQGLPLVQNEPLIYGMVPCIRNLILLIQTGDTFPKTRSRTVWIRFEFLEFRFCRNRCLWKKKYLFDIYFRLSVSVLSLLINQDSPFIGLRSAERNAASKYAPLPSFIAYWAEACLPRRRWH